MSESATDPPAGTPEGLGKSLRVKLSALRRKLVRVELIRRLAIAISFAISGLAVLLLVDWLVGLSMEVRVAVLAVLAGVTLILLARAFVALITQRQDEESLALLVEEKQPGFRSRLIASVQFARGKANIPDASAAAMVDRLVSDTETYAKPIALTKFVNTAPLKRALIGLLLLGGLAVGGYYAGGGITQDLLKRAFLSDIPVPRATRVTWTSGDRRIGIGDSVTVEARAEGFLPERGTLRVRFESGRSRKVTMEALGDPGRYAATIENVQESFTYQAVLHDGRSERRDVRALPRPVVVGLVGRQTYPDYTRLGPSDHKPGEFLLFPGSKLDLTIEVSQPLKWGKVRLLGSSGEVTGEVDRTDSRFLRASFIAPDRDLTGFTISLLDTEEMASKDATVYRVDILSDEPPKVRIVRPSRQRELVTTKAKLLVGYEAEDRFGIEGLALHYLVGDREARSLELPIPEKGAKQVAERFDWDLADLDPGLVIGDEVQFWIEAYDQNARTAAGKSNPRFLKVVTDREKRDDLLGRVGDSLGRVDQATDNQGRLNAALADWIRAQAPLSARPAPNDPESNDGNEE